MAKRRRTLMPSSNDDDTTDESSLIGTNGESDRGYETEVTEPDSDAPRDRRRGKRKRRQLRYKPNIPASKEATTTSIASDDSDDSTDPDDDTDDEMSSGDEDDDYSDGAKLLIARLENHWQRSVHSVAQLHTS
jgi:hypothetical protein